MSDLVDFAKRVQMQLADVNRPAHWEQSDAERYMAEINVRRERFERVTTRLSSIVIQPRLEILPGYFPNANSVKHKQEGRCSYWFEYSERFPAGVKVAIAVEHDLHFEKVIVCYEAIMVPVFIKLNEHDKLTLSLDDVQDDVVASWVEERLLEFLQLYLQIDCGGDDLGDETATDPVCGMRIPRSSAVAGDGYRGHAYFFCSRECRERFAREPTAYVEVKAM